MRRCLIVALALLPLLSVRADEPSKAEKQALARIAREWTDLGKWCHEKKLEAAARTCAERAAAADPNAPALAPLEAATGEDAADEPARKELERRLKATSKKAAASWDALASAFKPGQADAALLLRASGWEVEALSLDAEPKRWTRFVILGETFLGLKDAKKNTAALGALAERALTLSPPEKVASRVHHLADAPLLDRLVLKKARKHEIRYWISLPRSFERKKDKRWPVLVCVDGAGSGFEGMGGAYKNARGDLPYIVVAPCTFSNTNQIVGDAGQMANYAKLYPEDAIKDGDRRRLDFDEEGIVAILDELAETHDADAKAYVTGFSGGGIATYMMVCKHPDRLMAAAPACGNFRQLEYSNTQKGKIAAADLVVPIFIFTGEKDPHREWTFGKKDGVPGIEPQTDRAEKVLDDLGLKNRKRTMIPGMGHSPAVEHVVAAFKPYLLGQKKRGEL